MNALYWVLAVALLLAAVPAQAALQTWFAPSALKVMRDAQPTKAVRWEMAAARGEDEACQVVMLSDKGTSVRVQAGDLAHTRGKGSLPVTLRQVAYVPIGKDRVPTPDPLPPLAGSLRLRANQAQPVWVMVRVPADAAPGRYRGTLRVEGGGETKELPLSLVVWDFALPATPSCVTAFGISGDWAARAHGLEPGTEAARALYAKYYEMLLDHKVSAYSIPVDLMSEQAPRYLNDPRMTSYLIPYPEDDGELGRLVSRLVAGGWFRKGYFYPLDEPVTKEAYDRLLAMAARLRRLEPRYRLVTPFFRNPDWDEKLTAYDLLTGVDTIWCPNEHFFDLEAKTRPYLAARKAAGDEVWWYVCCGPGSPYNNFFVQMSGMAHRMLFWNQWREGVQGLLYWSTTWWNPNPAVGTADPWSDMATVKDINPDIAGDGSLFYPGTKVGVDGPVSSQRLEIIRDGIEDFDYLTLAGQRLGPEATREYVARLVRSLTDYEQDPLRLEAVRRELGAALEKATREARRCL